jgi:hypothetical protein
MEPDEPEESRKQDREDGAHDENGSHVGIVAHGLGA